MQRLFTREDKWHVHKALGVGALASFGYHCTAAFRRGDHHHVGIGCALMHAALSVSSLVFRIPNNRVKGAPMIWPEFRLHSIAFALRSIAAILVNSGLGNSNVARTLRGMVIIATFGSADWASQVHATNSTTMRDMPFPKWVGQRSKAAWNLFYSVSQVLATMNILTDEGTVLAFFTLVPIQLAAFLMTCVRKGLIRGGHWHAAYTAALLLNYVYCSTNDTVIDSNLRLWYWALAATVVALRFGLRCDKYVLWTGVVLCWNHVVSTSAGASTPAA